MEHDAIAERLAHLERSYRRLRRGLILLTVASVGWSIGAFCFMPVGLVRNVWHRQFIGLTALGDTAVQAFWNTRKERRIELGVGSKGYPTIDLLGSDSTPRLALWVRDDDTPVLRLYKPGLGHGIRIDLRDDNSPEVVMVHPSGKASIFLGFLPDSTPVVQLKDKEGNLIFRTPVPADVQETPATSDDRTD